MFSGKQIAGSDFELKDEFQEFSWLFPRGRPIFAVFLRGKLSCVDLFDQIWAKVFVRTSESCLVVHGETDVAIRSGIRI